MYQFFLYVYSHAEVLAILLAAIVIPLAIASGYFIMKRYMELF